MALFVFNQVKRLARLLKARRVVLACLSAPFFLNGAAAPAQAACVAAALNRFDLQIEGTRSVTRGIFPRVVCNRALSRCERRLNRLRIDTGRPRPHARCVVIASGLRADSVFGPPVEGAARRGFVDRYRDDRAYDGYEPRGEDLARRPDRYDDPYARDDYRPDLRRGDGLDAPGSHDGWRSAERDPLLDGLIDEPEPRGDPRDWDEADRDRYDRDYEVWDPNRPAGDGRYADDYYDPRFGDDRYARSCNFDACSARYKTFRASDCSYKPTIDTRRQCTL